MTPNPSLEGTLTGKPSRPRSGVVHHPLSGGLLTPIVAFGLALVLLLPTVSGYLGLDGKFDVLWLMGLPFYALWDGIID
jgi:hypothetical protein